MASEHPCLGEGTRDSGKADSEAHWHRRRVRAAMTGTELPATLTLATGSVRASTLATRPPVLPLHRRRRPALVPALAPSGPSSSLVHSAQNSAHSCH